MTKLHNVNQPKSDAAWFRKRMQYHENVVNRIDVKKLMGNYVKNGIPSRARKLKLLELELILEEKRMNENGAKGNENENQEPKYTPPRDSSKRAQAALYYVSPNWDLNISVYWYSKNAIRLFNPSQDFMSYFGCLLAN